jgi:hypothetical protein
MPKIRQSNTVEVDRPQPQSITSKRLAAGERVKSLKTLGELSRWKPGQSGNPGGKPRVLAEILAMGHSNTPAIMQRLIDAALHSADAAVWIPAAREVLNRTFGKPSQQVEVIGGVEHRHFVLRAPTVLESSEAWEQKYGQVIDASTSEAQPEPARSEPDAPVEPTEELGSDR